MSALQVVHDHQESCSGSVLHALVWAMTHSHPKPQTDTLLHMRCNWVQARLHDDSVGAAPPQAEGPATQTAAPDPHVASEQPADSAAATSAAGLQPAAVPDAAQATMDNAAAPAEGAAAAAGAPGQQPAGQPGPCPSAGAPGPEADPFGLGPVLEQQHALEAQLAAAAAWTPEVPANVKLQCFWGIEGQGCSRRPEGAAHPETYS